MLACARLGAVHSVVFGGFAPHELAVRIDDARPKVVVSASCGIEGSRVIEYKPLLDRALDLAGSSRPGALRRPAAAPGHRRAARRARRRLGRGRGRRRAPPLRARRGHRPALRALHLGHDRQAQGRRPRQRRPRGGAAVEHGERLRRGAGRGVLGGQRRRLGRRPQLHRLRAAAVGLHHRPLRGQAGRHPRRRRVLAGGRRARGVGAVHRAHRHPGDQEGGRRRASTSPATTSPAAGAVPRRRAHRPRHLRLGVRAARRAGHRPLVADRDGLGDRRRTAWASSSCRSSPARRPSPSPATGSRSSTTPASPVPTGRGRGHRHPAAAAAGLAADPLARRRALRGVVPVAATRATTSPATAATSTRTATCS